MESYSSTTQTMRSRSLSPTSTISLAGLDLSSIPPIAVLSAHLKDDEVRVLKETLRQYDAPIANDVSKAKVFVGKVGTPNSS
jgi:DNA polymerase IV